MTSCALSSRTLAFVAACTLGLALDPIAPRAVAQAGHDHSPMGHDGHAHHPAMSAASTGTGPEALDDLAVPDVAVVDQNGRATSFYRDLVRGKTVAVNFVFTTCNTICNPQGSNFAELRKLLGAKAGREVHLVSISIDPETDTPARLKAWSEKFGAGPGWTLVTGKKPEVTKLLKALGAYNADRSQHTPILLLGNDATGKWQRSFALAPPAQIASLLAGLSGDSVSTRGGGR